MIIESSKVIDFGRTVNFCDGISIKFNGLGKATITDAKAKILFEAGYDWLFEEGTREVDEEVKGEAINSETKAELEKSQTELINIKDRVGRREKAIEVLKGEVTEWKKIATELGKKSEKNNTQEGEEVAALKVEIESCKIHIGLLELKDGELRNMAQTFKVECKDAKFKHEEKLELIEKLLEANEKAK